MADLNKYHNGHVPANRSYFSIDQKNGESNQNKNEIDFKKLFFTLWNRKWIIIGSVLVFGLLAGIIAYNITPIYESEGTLLISEPQGNYSLGGAGSDLGNLLSSSYGLGVGSTFANELQVLRSRKLSKAVADTLMKQRLMSNGWEFPVLFKAYPDDSSMTSQDTVAARIRKNISFSKVNLDAEVVQITYDSPSPLEAAHVIDMTMALYKNLSTSQNRSSAGSAVAFLQKERTRIKGNLEDAEEKLRNFMNNSKLVEVDAQTQELIKQMADLGARRQEANAKLVAANSAIKQYQDQLNKIKPGLAEQYSDAIGPNISKLQYALSELELQKQQLLAQNPGLKESSSQLEDINRKITVYKNRIKVLTQNLINKSDQYLGFLGGGEAGVAENISELNKNLIEMQVQQKQYTSEIKVLDKQLGTQKKFFNNLPDNIIDLAKLKRDVKINEELYTTVAQQYAETALWEQTQFGLGRLIDGGNIPKHPVKPNKALYILIGFILGGMLSVGFILVRDAFNTTIDGVEKMRELDEPLLSVIPSMKDYIKEHHNGKDKVLVQKRNISTSLITVLDSISPISESFRRLQNNLIYSNPDSKLSSIMLTSSGKGEGKTTTISNLGVVLAEAGYNTLIVDTDFRRPNLHNMFGLKKTPGFMEVLFDDIHLEEAIRKTIIPGLSVIPSGRKPPNAAAITQSHAFLDLLKKLETMFDFVLIDTPPFGIITDSAAMLRQVHGVVVVAKFGETTKIQLMQTLEQLHRLNANITGTVLSAFDHTKSDDYYLSSNYYKEVYKDYNAYQDEIDS